MPGARRSHPHAPNRRLHAQWRVASPRHPGARRFGIARRHALDRATHGEEALAAAYAGASREVAAAHFLHRWPGRPLELRPGSRRGARAGREIQGHRPPHRRRSYRSRMTDRTTLAVRFLTSMAQALATMSLYAEGHPARARAAVASFDTLRELQQADPRPSFSFLG